MFLFVAEQLRITVMESNIVGAIKGILTYLEQRNSMVTSGLMPRKHLDELIATHVNVCIAHIRSVSNIHTGMNSMYMSVSVYVDNCDTPICVCQYQHMCVLHVCR